MMGEFPKGQRLVKVLLFLIRKRGTPVTVPEIKKYLDGEGNEDVEIRSVQRDMNDLLMGLPDLVQGGNKKTGYTYSLPDSLLNLAFGQSFQASEVLAGYILKKLQPAFKGTRLESAFSKLLDKAEERMKAPVIEDLDRQASNLEGGFEFLP